MKRRILALALCAGLLSAPALAAEEAAPQPQAIAPWAYDAMAEAVALGMWDDSYYYCIENEVTDEQLDKLCAAVADKLALLGMPENTENAGPAVGVIDHTRGGVVNALYKELSTYHPDFLTWSSTPESVLSDMLQEMGQQPVIQGDETGDYHLDRVCTLQEAIVMSQRLVLSLYDYYGAGSQGLLWKAEGNGNTLYLLGTIHVDRGNVYPFAKQLRDIIAASDDAAFEVDFDDTTDTQAAVALQMYSDGTTLKDHISPALYEEVSTVLTGLGMTQDQVDILRAWVLGSSLSQMGLMDTSSGDVPLALDQYIHAKARNNGATIGAVESMTYQIEHVFNTLSDEYQEAYLQAGLDLYRAGTAGGDDTAGSLEQIDAMLTAWKVRDVAGFETSYHKDAILNSDDELNVKLFTQRDPNMIAYADSYLKADGPHTGILVVGAGHMVGGTGVVQGLKDLGYTVEVVPVESGVGKLPSGT